MRRIEKDDVEAAVVGGCLLGGGGGGDPEKGRKIGALAVEAGSPRLASIDELPGDAVVVTVSAVGAPAAAGQYCTPMHYVRAVEILRAGGVRVDGLVSSENGGLASVNGWFQAAVLGVPVVDAPCNGRAHPMGTMGSIGLHLKPDYVSRQAAAGGSPDAGKYVELSVAAGIAEASRLVRQAAVSADGLVAVARNPVPASYAKDHAAPGALGQAISLGRTMIEASANRPAAAAVAAAAFLGGDVAAEGRVSGVLLETKGGFDVGKVTVDAGRREYSMTFWNEYMTLERDGERLATFPDLIATVDLATGMAVPTAGIREGMEIAVVRAGKDRLRLGAGMRDPGLFVEAERILGLPIVRYAF